MSFPVLYTATVDLLTIQSIVLVPQSPIDPASRLLFLPQFCYVSLRTLVGPALTTAPKIRAGSNAAHNDVAPIFTVPLGASVGVVANLPLVTFPMSPPHVSLADIFLEVTQAAIGPTAMTGDIVIQGLLVSG